MNRKTIAVIVGIIVIIALWAAFRPELLFVKKPVDEPLPGASSYAPVRADFTA